MTPMKPNISHTKAPFKVCTEFSVGNGQVLAMKQQNQNGPASVKRYVDLFRKGNKQNHFTSINYSNQNT